MRKKCLIIFSMLFIVFLTGCPPVTPAKPQTGKPPPPPPPPPPAATRQLLAVTSNTLSEHSYPTLDAAPRGITPMPFAQRKGIFAGEFDDGVYAGADILCLQEWEYLSKESLAADGLFASKGFTIIKNNLGRATTGWFSPYPGQILVAFKNLSLIRSEFVPFTTVGATGSTNFPRGFVWATFAAAAGSAKPILGVICTHLVGGDGGSGDYIGFRVAQLRESLEKIRTVGGNFPWLVMGDLNADGLSTGYLQALSVEFSGVRFRDLYDDNFKPTIATTQIPAPQTALDPRLYPERLDYIWYRDLPSLPNRRVLPSDYNLLLNFDQSDATKQFFSDHAVVQIQFTVQL